MKVYISYDEALKLIDAKERWLDMSLEEANQQWLYQNTDAIRTVLCEGKLLIEKGSLLQRFQKWIDPPQGKIPFDWHVSELTLQEVPNDALNKSKSHKIAFIDAIMLEGHRLVVEELKASLKSNDKFKMFTCNCTDFFCGGTYMEVKHLGNIICWHSAYPAMAEHYPISYLWGKLNDKKVLIPLPIYFSKDQLIALVK